METLFDKKFVITAIVIGFIYVCIVIFVNLVIGSEAAGIAGVALTALSTAIFKQFENLRFKQVDPEKVKEYRFNWWLIIILSLFFLSFNYFMQELKNGIIVHIIPYESASDYWNSGSEKEAYVMFVNGQAIRNYGIWIVGCGCFTYFIGGIISAKAWARMYFSVVIVSALISLILEYLLINDMEPEYSPLYLVFAWIGTFLVESNRRPKLIEKL